METNHNKRSGLLEKQLCLQLVALQSQSNSNLSKKSRISI